MALFPLPTAAAVVTESRLKPNQVDNRFQSDAPLLTETRTRIVAKADFVTTKLLSHSSKGDWGEDSTWPAEDRERRQGLATEATKIYSIASLFGSAGQFNSAYWQRATDKKAEAKELLDALLDDLDKARKDATSGEQASNGTTARRSGSVAVQTNF